MKDNSSLSQLDFIFIHVLSWESVSSWGLFLCFVVGGVEWQDRKSFSWEFPVEVWSSTGSSTWTGSVLSTFLHPALFTQQAFQVLKLQTRKSNNNLLTCNFIHDASPLVVFKTPEILSELRLDPVLPWRTLKDFMLDFKNFSFYFHYKLNSGADLFHL